MQRFYFVRLSVSEDAALDPQSILQETACKPSDLLLHRSSFCAGLSHLSFTPMILWTSALQILRHSATSLCTHRRRSATATAYSNRPLGVAAPSPPRESKKSGAERAERSEAKEPRAEPWERGSGRRTSRCGAASSPRSSRKGAAASSRGAN